MHYSLISQKQKVTALVDTGAEYTLIHGNPQKFSGLLSAIDGYGGQTVMVRKIPFTLQIGHSLPQEEHEVLCPTPENILGLNNLQGQTLQTSIHEFCLKVRVIKPLFRRNDNWEQVSVLTL